jgi:hypothetical protein
MGMLGRYVLFVGVVLGLLAAVVGWAGAAGSRAQAARNAPVVDCVVEPITLTLNLQGPAPDTRPFTNTVGDSYTQFLAPPITTTAASTTSLLVNGAMAGTVGGSLSGSATLEATNGAQVSSPGGFLPNPRGFTVSRVFLVTDRGAITATLAANYAALTNFAPYYPRLVNAYLASNDMSGALAGQLLMAPLVGYQTYAGGAVTFAGTGAGRLFSGAGAFSAVVGAARTAPQERAAALAAGDAISQFRSALIHLPVAGAGRVQPVTELTGTIAGGITGAFLAPVTSLLLDPAGVNGRGWQAGNLGFTDANADLLAGVWLGDLSGGNTLRGFVYQIAGTGAYSTSMLFAGLTGTYFAGGTLFAGNLSGAYCAGSALPTATPGAPTENPTAAPSATATAPAGSTPTPSATAPASATATAGATETAAPSATTTRAPTATSTAPPTSTPPPATATPTVCAARFADVTPNDFFYTPTQYLACRLVIGGYTCGGPGEPCNATSDPYFRPYANTTRGQLTKMVAAGLGWAPALPATPTFADVPASQPFYPFIETAVAHRVISGYTCGGPGEPCDSGNRPYFRPYANVTRGQLSKIIVGAKGWPLADPAAPTFADGAPGSLNYAYIETAVAHAIISGYSCGGPGEPCDSQNRPYFRQFNNATRGQIAKIVYLALTQP